MLIPAAVVNSPQSAFDGRPGVAPRAASTRARLAIAAGAGCIAALIVLANAGLARATDSIRPPSDAIGGVATAPPAQQAADTDQSSSADARANQPQQSNVTIVIRINSPGDDTITQTNTISVDATSTNNSATNQAQAQQPIVAAAAAAAQKGVEAPRGVTEPSRDATGAVRAQAAPQIPTRGRALLADYAQSSSSSAAVVGSAPKPTVRHSPAAPKRAAAAWPIRPVASTHSSQTSAPRVARSRLPRHDVQRRAPSAAGTSKLGLRGVGRVLGLAGVLGGGGRAAASLGLAAEPGSRGPSLATLLAVLLAGAFGWTILAWAPRRPNILRAYRRG
jgi:hypothetical protein